MSKNTNTNFWAHSHSHKQVVNANLNVFSQGCVKKIITHSRRSKWSHINVLMIDKMTKIYINGEEIDMKKIYRSLNQCQICYEIALRKKLGLAWDEPIPSEKFINLGLERTVCPHYNKVKKSISEPFIPKSMGKAYNKTIKEILSWGWGLLESKHALPATCPNFFKHLEVYEILPCKDARPKKRSGTRLNKNICKSCVKQRNNGVWAKNDNKLWEKHGMVRCACEPVHLTHHARPEKCPFFMEQTLCRGYNKEGK